MDKLSFRRIGRSFLFNHPLGAIRFAEFLDRHGIRFAWHDIRNGGALVRVS